MASLALGLGLAAAGSIGGAAIGAGAASSAASTQAAASENAAQLQYQASQNALGFQEGEFNTEQQNFAPWLGAGENGLTTLQYLMGVGPNPGAAQPGNPLGTGTTARPTGGPSMPTGATPQISNGSTASPGGFSRPVASVPGPNGTMVPATTTLGNLMGPTPYSGAQPTGGPQPPAGATGTPSTNLGTYGSLMSPFPGGQFTPPTAEQANQSPAEQAELKLSQQALQQSAAAQGNLLTGGTAEALNQNAENIAATNYQNVYNNSLNTFSTNYNTWQQQQQNLYNRLAALSGVGQTTAQQLGQLGQGASNNVSNNLLTTGQLMGQSLQNAGAANASGIVGSANAWNGGITGATGGLTQSLLLSQLMNGGGATGPGSESWMLGPGTPGVSG